MVERVGTYGAVESNALAAVDAIGRVDHLPHPPGAVYHGVVEVEGRVAGADVEVATRVAAHGVVAAACEEGQCVSRRLIGVHDESNEMLFK